MQLELLPVYRNLDHYLDRLTQPGADYRILWDEYAIRPYWDRLSRWAPFDLSDRKPKPVIDASKLGQQIALLNRIDLGRLEKEFTKIMEMLPIEDDDLLTVAIYPLDDGETFIKEHQNGVPGTSVFGNMIIQVNPFANHYEEWIPYVFAHEYHHSAWGDYWYGPQGGVTGQFIESMVNEGQADSFALSLFPQLKPQWLNQIPADKEAWLWNKHYAGSINSTDFDYFSLMFGNEAKDIPWCAGYDYGYKIIQCYLEHNPGVSFKQLLEINAQQIFENSGYMQS